MKGSIVFVFFLLSTLVFGQPSPNVSRFDSLVSAARYDEALKFIRSELAVYGDAWIPYISNRAAAVLILQGKLDEADAELKKIKMGNDPLVDAVTKTNQGFLYLNKARNDLALESLQSAMNSFQEAHSERSLEAATCLSYLSQVYLTTGKLNQAEENGNIALEIRRRLKGADSEEVAASYNDLGLIYGQRDPEKGLEYYEMALEVYMKIHGEDHPKIAIANTNMGFAYRGMKLYGDAITNLEVAESIWEKIYPDGHANQALALFNLGLTYAQMGNKTAAQGYFDRALAIDRKFYGTKHPDIAYVLNQIGMLNLGDNKYDAALNNFQEALVANAPLFNSKEIRLNPSAKDFYNGKVLLYSLRQKALALEGKHFGKTLKFEELKLALASLQTCDSLIDEIRYHSTDENDKLELGASANEVYEDGVRIAQAMSEMTLDARPYQESAFYFAEKSKSAVLQESIADSEAKSFAGIPAQLLDEEKILKSNISLLSQKLSQKPNLAEERKLREDLFAANREYERFTKKLESDFPDYYNLKYNTAAPSIAALQKMLDNKTAIISYFIADGSKRLYTFTITRSKFRIYNSKLPDEFDRLIKGFNNSLYYTVFDSYQEASGNLSKLLLRGIPGAVDELVIIPSGRLSTLPFESLSLNNLTSTRDFSSVNYLIAKYGVSYEFSAGLLLQKSKASNALQTQSIFLCAPISFPEKDNLNDLPGSQQEVNNIAKLFPSNAFIATGSDANESLVKSEKIANYRYLHFATHGVVDETSPELSRIFLQTAAQEDGNVYSGEIFNMTLNSDLTVLSACQTGLGKFSKGEGVIGLSRALVYAGSKNIMVSYWSVADESTSILMTDFYKYLLEQPTPDFRAALKKAKIQMIAGGKYSAPYYWAPFVLIGF